MSVYILKYIIFFVNRGLVYKWISGLFKDLDLEGTDKSLFNRRPDKWNKIFHL